MTQPPQGGLPRPLGLPSQQPSAPGPYQPYQPYPPAYGSPPPPGMPPSAPPPAGRPRRPWWVAAAVAAVLLAGGGTAWLLASGGDGDGGGEEQAAGDDTPPPPTAEEEEDPAPPTENTTPTADPPDPTPDPADPPETPHGIEGVWQTDTLPFTTIGFTEEPADVTDPERYSAFLLTGTEECRGLHQESGPDTYRVAFLCEEDGQDSGEAAGTARVDGDTLTVEWDDGTEETFHWYAEFPDE